MQVTLSSAAPVSHLPTSNPPPQTKTSPLYIAAQLGHLDVVRLLLDRGANKDAANNVGALMDRASQLPSSSAISCKC
jgi:ankyrin repeat protein